MGFFDRLLGGMIGGHHGGGGRGHGGGGHGGGGGHHGGYGPYSGGPAAGAPPGTNCPNCSAGNPAGARFCQQCGTSLAPAKCASCGAELAAGAKFCAQCGKPRA